MSGLSFPAKTMPVFQEHQRKTKQMEEEKLEYYTRDQIYGNPKIKFVVKPDGSWKYVNQKTGDYIDIYQDVQLDKISYDGEEWEDYFDNLAKWHYEYFEQFPEFDKKKLNKFI